MGSSTHLLRNIILTNQSIKYGGANGTSGVVTTSGLKGHSPKPGTLKDCGYIKIRADSSMTGTYPPGVCTYSR